MGRKAKIRRKTKIIRKSGYIRNMWMVVAVVALGLSAAGCQAVSRTAESSAEVSENSTGIVDSSAGVSENSTGIAESSAGVSESSTGVLESSAGTAENSGEKNPAVPGPDSGDQLNELPDKAFTFDSFVSHEGEIYARVYIQILSEAVRQAPGAGIFTIYQDHVYYVNGSPVSGEESRYSYELHRCRLDGGGDETIARDAVLSTSVQPTIVGDRLIYAYGAGGSRTGLVISTLDGRKRKEYKLDDLDIIGFDASYVYYQKSVGGEKRGTEIWALDPDTQERIRLVAAPNWDEAGGLGRFQVIDGVVYAWCLKERPEENQDTWKYSLRAWELQEKTVRDIEYPGVISYGGDFALIEDQVYFTGDGWISRCRLDGNGKSGEPEALAQLGEEVYWAEDYMAAGDWLYYIQLETIDEETGNNTYLCRVPMAGGDVEKVCMWYVP